MRRSYRRSGPVQSDKDIADHLISLIRADATEGGNWRAVFFKLANVKPSIQRRVLNAFRVPKGPGRPQNALPDEDWSLWLDNLKAMYRSSYNLKDDASVQDLKAIEFGLEATGTRLGRKSDKPFELNTEEGKREIRRIRDKAYRGRKSQKVPK